MSLKLNIPSLGDGDVKGVVGHIELQPGDCFSAGDTLMEVETDKVVVEIPAESDGTLVEFLVATGDNVSEGDEFALASIAIISTEEENETPVVEVLSPVNEIEKPSNIVESEQTVKESISSTPAEPQLFLLPALGDGDVKGTVGGIHIDVGSHIKAGDVVLEIETDKVVVEIPAEVSGEVISIHVKADETVQMGDGYVTIKAEGVAQTESTLKAEEELVQASNLVESKPVEKAEPIVSVPKVTGSVQRAGPSVRRFAREMQVALEKVSGTGPRGQITVADVKGYIRQKVCSTETAQTVTSDIVLPDVSAFGSTHTEQLTGIGVAVANNMQRSWSQVPHAWAEQVVDITDIEAGRKRLKAEAVSQGVGLTITAFLCKAMALAVKQYPRFNACFDSQSNSLIYRDYVNIGVAVDTQRGLVVPVLRDVDTKTVLQIAAELGELSKKANANKLALSDLQGAGITLSNLGSVGVTGLKPMVNWPEVAILGVGTGKREPVCIGDSDELAIRLNMPMTLAIDHRVINGADAARFLGVVKRAMEDPVRMMIGL